MSMFDNIKIINTSLPGIEFCNEWFQTKDLDGDSSEFVIFNDQLFMSYDGSVPSAMLTYKQVDFSGEINIYGQVQDGKKTRWLEYDLDFVDGRLSSIALIVNVITKDVPRDQILDRPYNKHEHVKVTIEHFGCKNKTAFEKFHSNLSNNLEFIRDATGDPDALIIYQQKPPADDIRYSLYPYIWIHSIVQRYSDFI